MLSGDHARTEANSPSSLVGERLTENRAILGQVLHRAREAGWSLEEIAVYAGHQTKDGVPAIATTVRYTLPSRKQLKERVQLLQG